MKPGLVISYWGEARARDLVLGGSPGSWFSIGVARGEFLFQRFQRFQRLQKVWETSREFPPPFATFEIFEIFEIEIHPILNYEPGLVI